MPVAHGSLTRGIFLFQLFQMFYQVYEYIRWDNLLEWATFVTSIIYVSTEFKETESFGIKKYVFLIDKLSFRLVLIWQIIPYRENLLFRYFFGKA